MSVDKSDSLSSGIMISLSLRDKIWGKPFHNKMRKKINTKQSIDETKHEWIIFLNFLILIKSDGNYIIYLILQMLSVLAYWLLLLISVYIYQQWGVQINFFFSPKKKNNNFNNFFLLNYDI